MSQLAAIVQWSDDPIITTTLVGVIVTWNRAANLLYGYGDSEMVGNHLSVLVPPEGLGEMEQFLAGVRSGERVPHTHTEWIAKSGERIEVELTISPIRDTEGKVVGASAVTRDIAEHRWIASTLDTTLSQLEEALEEAKVAEARSRRFLADAAHQLRTPLTGIRACADTLLRRPSEAVRERLLADMVQETSRAARLVSSLLTVAHIDQGQALSCSSCDVVTVCDGIAQRARMLAPHLEVSVKAGPVERLPELDANAVQELLSNLVDNARRHAVRRIAIVVEVDADWLQIKVLDDGPGVPEAVADQVFERFVSLDGQGGSGLGLAIARDLARAHGGDLVCEGGFVVRLPIVPVLAAGPSQPTPPRRAPAAVSG